MSLAAAPPPAASAEAPSAGASDWSQPALIRFVTDTAAICDVEVRKLRHDPLEVLTRAVQPVLWLLVFGKVMARTHAIPTGNIPYLDFLAPGILAQSALFVSIFYGIAVIWERDLGVLHKFLVSPASRVALVSGKALSAGVRALAQAVIVYVLAAAIGVNLRLTPLPLVGVISTGPPRFSWTLVVLIPTKKPWNCSGNSASQSALGKMWHTLQRIRRRF